MRLRTLPPAAAPNSAADLLHGVLGLWSPKFALTRLQRQLQEGLGVRHVHLLSSGRGALATALSALAYLSPRRTVVIPAYTCFSVPAAVVRAGLEVVACDVDPRTLDFDYVQLQAILARRPPLCVVATHLFGPSADVQRLLILCRSSRTFVVEDAAQAFGMRQSGRWCGTAADVGVFSFGRGKAISASGGGALVCSSDDVNAAVCTALIGAPATSRWRASLSLGQALLSAVMVRPSLYWLPAGIPFLRLGETHYRPSFPVRCLSGTQAGMLLDCLRRAEADNRARRARLLGLANAAPLHAITDAACLRLPLLCRSSQEREALLDASQREGLGFTAMYPSTITSIPTLLTATQGHKCPGAELLASRLVTIPVHTLVSQRDENAIGSLLCSLYTSDPAFASTT